MSFIINISFYYSFFPFFYSIFLKSLQKCIQNSVELGPLIKRYKQKLHMYVIYCRNKPVSEHIVAEHLGYFEEIRSKLKHKLVVSNKTFFLLKHFFFHSKYHSSLFSSKIIFFSHFKFMIFITAM